MKHESSFSWRGVEAAMVLLLWLQAARTLFSNLFGVIYDAVFDGDVGMSYVLLVAALLILALVLPSLTALIGQRGRKGRVPQETMMLVAVAIAAAARVPLTLNEPQLRLFLSIVVIAAAGVYLSRLVTAYSSLVAPALVWAFVIDQLARVYGHTWDVTIQPGFLVPQIVISLILIVIAWIEYGRPVPPEKRSPGRFGLWGGVALGGLLFVQTAVFSQPNVLARWSETSYALAVPALILVTVSPLFTIARQQYQAFGGLPLQTIRRWGVLARLAVILLPGVVGLILGARINGVAGLLLLLLAQLALVWSVPQLITQLPEENAGRRHGDWAVALGQVVFFVLHLAFAFAFTYPYTIAPFKGTGLAIVAVGVVLALLPAWLRPPESGPIEKAPVNNQLVVILTFVMISVLVRSDPAPAVPREAPAQVRIATYNIHYGYNTTWEFTLAEQAAAIQTSGADVIVMQEVDAGRITSYGVDDALWLAHRLDMQAVFAPALEGLSGVALLTRLPITDSDWQLLPSELEQTALVHARLEWGTQSLDVFGVWLGLSEEERLRQIDATLQRIGETSPAALGGDLNSKPDSQVYARIGAAGFVDPFVVTGQPDAVTDPAIEPSKRIDFVWVRGVQPTGASVASSLASDHRMVLVTIE